MEDTKEGDGAFYYQHRTYKILSVTLHGVLCMVCSSITDKQPHHN